MEESRATGQGESREEGSEDADAERPSDAAPAERPKHDDSELDAMGRPKRREVVGQGYGPSKGRQLVSYAAAVGVIIGLYFAAQFAVGKLDKAPAHDKAQAPWAQKNASQAAAQRFQ